MAPFRFGESEGCSCDWHALRILARRDVLPQLLLMAAQLFVRLHRCAEKNAFTSCPEATWTSHFSFSEQSSMSCRGTKHARPVITSNTKLQPYAHDCWASRQLKRYRRITAINFYSTYNDLTCNVVCYKKLRITLLVNGKKISAWCTLLWTLNQ